MQQEQDPTMADQNLEAEVQAPTVAPGPQNGSVRATTPQSGSGGQATIVTGLDSTTSATDSGAIAAGEIPRSSRWPAVERAHLLAHPTCAACGQGQAGQRALQVHHMLPFHFCVKLGRPELELDERNLMTLCDETINNHHLLLGHLGDFQSYNPNVKADVVGPLGQLGDAQIDTDPTWQMEMRQRPPFLYQMNSEQIGAFKVLMDTWYPLKPGSGNS